MAHVLRINMDTVVVTIKDFKGGALLKVTEQEQLDIISSLAIAASEQRRRALQSNTRVAKTTRERIADRLDALARALNEVK